MRISTRTAFVISVFFFTSSAHAALDLAELNDRAAVEEKILTLFIKTDEKDWPAVREVFTPQVKFDMSSLTGQAASTMAADAIAAMWEKGLAPIQAIHHQAGNFRYQFGPGGADVRCYGIAYHYRAVKSHKNTRVFVGSYHFHLVRIEGAWKIDAIRYNSQFVDGNLKLDSEK
jgi:hypothetical protein